VQVDSDKEGHYWEQVNNFFVYYSSSAANASELENVFCSFQIALELDKVYR
jgi:hypothetical protein